MQCPDCRKWSYHKEDIRNDVGSRVSVEELVAVNCTLRLNRLVPESPQRATLSDDDDKLKG
jgi:hypothetical protein